MTPLAYFKWGSIAAIGLALTSGGFYFGNLRGEVKAAKAKTEVAEAKTALETDHAAMARAATDALLAQRSRIAADAAADKETERQHAKDLHDIDSIAPIGTPVVVYQYAPADRLHPGTVSGAEGQTGAGGADSTEGGSEPVDRGRNIRPAIEEVKKRLERVMADYRQEDSEWPQGLAPK